MTEDLFQIKIGGAKDFDVWFVDGELEIRLIAEEGFPNIIEVLKILPYGRLKKAEFGPSFLKLGGDPDALLNTCKKLIDAGLLRKEIGLSLPLLRSEHREHKAKLVAEKLGKK